MDGLKSHVVVAYDLGDVTDLAIDHIGQLVRLRRGYVGFVLSGVNFALDNNGVVIGCFYGFGWKR